MGGASRNERLNQIIKAPSKIGMILGVLRFLCPITFAPVHKNWRLLLVETQIKSTRAVDYWSR